MGTSRVGGIGPGPDTEPIDGPAGDCDAHPADADTPGTAPAPGGATDPGEGIEPGPDTEPNGVTARPHAVQYADPSSGNAAPQPPQKPVTVHRCL